MADLSVSTAEGMRGPLPDVDIPDVSLYQLIFDSLSEADLDQVAVVHHESGERLSYRELRTHVDAMAAWCAAQGWGPGSVVAIALPNCPAYLSAFHGILRAGATVTTLNVAYTTYEYERHLSETAAVAVVTTSQFLTHLAPAVASAGLGRERIILVGETSTRTDPLVEAGGHTSYADVLATHEPPPTLDLDPASHVAALPFSSGTTGLPKAVMLSHRNLVANVLQFAPVLEPSGDDHSFVALLPFSHIYALTTNLNFGLVKRFPIYTMSRFHPVDFLTIVATYRPTMLFIVPPVAAFLAKHPAVGQVDFSCVRVIVSGAAPLDGSLGDALASRLGAQVIQGYGMTELSPVTHVMPLNRPDIDHGTIGLAIPNVRFRIVDHNTGDVEVPADGSASAPGELWCAGPNVMLGYFGHQEATDATVDADGWVHTGDLATVDNRGAVRIVDRIKELIKMRGFQVAPAELEAILCSHPQVADAAVLGIAVPGSAGDQAPHALVQRVEGATVSEKEIADYLAERVARYKHLRTVHFVETVPRSAAGKILRRELPALLP